ncbi:MAG: hypothetical protein ACNA8H_15010, partial [Anaerolineales bacterium]
MQGYAIHGDSARIPYDLVWPVLGTGAGAKLFADKGFFTGIELTAAKATATDNWMTNTVIIDSL